MSKETKAEEATTEKKSKDTQIFMVEGVEVEAENASEASEIYNNTIKKK